MFTVRSLSPKEALLLLGRNLPNQARTKDNLQMRPPIACFAGPLWGRWRTWVGLDEGKIRGLLSVRPRAGTQAWEIAYLSIAPEKEALALLQEPGLVLGERGAERLFLRLPADSPLLDLARQVSFMPYGEEDLFLGPPPLPSPPPLPLRPRSRHDDHQLFQLYSELVPHQMKQAEGASLQEWRDSQERWRTERIWEKEKKTQGWLQLEKKGRRGSLRVMATPEGLEGLLGYALRRLRGCSSLLCFAFPFQQELERSLVAYGFRKVGENTLLVKELVARARQRAFIPARA
jgi:hypothetical protein